MIRFVRDDRRVQSINQRESMLPNRERESERFSCHRIIRNILHRDDGPPTRINSRNNHEDQNDGNQQTYTHSNHASSYRVVLSVKSNSRPSEKKTFVPGSSDPMYATGKARGHRPRPQSSGCASRDKPSPPSRAPTRRSRLNLFV